MNFRLGAARQGVGRQRVSAHHQELNPGGDELGQDVAEVGIQQPALQ